MSISQSPDPGTKGTGQPSVLDRGALFSDCGGYRYRLWRIWEDSSPKVLWLMLNPSAADHERDDPTIRRCMAFTHSWGYDGMWVGNLFPRISTDPRQLLCLESIRGEGNEAHLEAMHRLCSLTICAWGNAPLLERLGGPPSGWLRQRVGPKAFCLGVSARGAPLHPLYVPGSMKPRVYDWPT